MTYLKSAFFLIIIFFACTTHSIAQQNLKREFRGVWVATVVNIDWPSKPGLSTATQKEELIKILDEHHRQGINAILFQIRPTADAFYSKSFEPWSKYLTGKQGLAPNPTYDPLEFAIQESHLRGMELHAWFNPYRATFDNKYTELDRNHIVNQKPEWFFTYEGRKLFNPGIPEVREYIRKVILNVVDNYDIDGVHFDDYFYPYAVAGQVINDGEAFSKYNNGITDIKDWRRYNVDQLIKTLSDSIHAHKNFVKFGISPFGIWKNKSQDSMGSETAGGDSFYGLFADSKKWVQEGWVDYINPQIYWSFETKAAPFNNLVDWWSNHTYGKHLYIGHGAYRINQGKDYSWKTPSQMSRQLNYTRANSRVQGSVFFSSKSLTNNPLGISDTLKNNFYKSAALPPVMLWLDSISPNKPENLLGVASNSGVLLSWKLPAKAKDGDAAYGFVVYRFSEGEEINLDKAEAIKCVYFTNITSWEDQHVENGKTYTYVVTSLDRLKNESKGSLPLVIVPKSVPHKH